MLDIIVGLGVLVGISLIFTVWCAFVTGYELQKLEDRIAKLESAHVPR
jgi:hypothetical protein